MASNKNIFCATNPARMLDALGCVIDRAGGDIADMLIFLPSRRAVRTVEKYLVARAGHSVILPRLVALGEGDDDDTAATDAPGEISNTQRVIIMARLLAADASIGTISAALPVAHDLLRMQDYLENEGVDAAQINWTELVDEKYATHFQRKAEILNIISRAQNEFYGARMTSAQVRNRDIRAWIDKLPAYSAVIVCGSTASVPATADLMAAVAAAENGWIILSGYIGGEKSEFELNTNPYNAEYKFLSRVGVLPGDVIPIDVGNSAIKFMNAAFSNNLSVDINTDAVKHCHLIECDRESEEASVIAEIASRAVNDNKSVLVITPDAAGNQRIATAFAARQIDADFSGAVPGTMTGAGRAILNAFDAWIERGDDSVFNELYVRNGCNLMRTITQMVDDGVVDFAPAFDIDDVASVSVWRAIMDLSDCLEQNDMRVNLSDARAFLGDVIGGTGVRNPMKSDARVCVLGTIESRMQTADVVILTGLNDGMFPARGYENAWLPRDVAQKIGLPSPDRKVSLQALDFINLSCGADVYWTRSRASGGVQTTVSRFLSRVMVRRGAYDIAAADDILRAVRNRDCPAPRPLDYSVPTPPADWSDVYVTELEKLIHNPYAFYVQHILRLRVLDDYWTMPDARHFGNLVHGVIEQARDWSPDALVREMDAAALKLLGPDSVMFHFWHRRFTEIAPLVTDIMKQIPGAVPEIGGMVNIAGRNIRARADRVWDGGVLDIKTGAVPTKAQLLDGTMPQLPLEALMLKTGGFHVHTTEKSQTPIMLFLQLKSGDVRTIEYDAPTTDIMMRAAYDKTTELVNMYSVGGAGYEYRPTRDRKYKVYDDLARVDD